MNVAVAKSNHANPARFEPCGARRVVCGLIRVGVRVAVYFDGEFGGGAVKVGDETVTDVLAADFESELVVSHASPNFALGGCERVAHVARPLENGWVDAAAFC